MAEGYMSLGRETTQVDSFDSVFNLHHNYVYRLAYGILGNGQDAEDATQEVFVRVYRSLPKYQPGRASIRTWLTKLTVNLCRTHRRRNLLHYFRQRPNTDRKGRPEPVDVSSWGEPEASVVRTETRQAVKEAISKMRLEYRTVLVLHYYLDLSCPEIADILGCPQGTVYSRLHYARRMVQAQLERQATQLAGSEEKL